MIIECFKHEDFDFDPTEEVEYPIDFIINQNQIMVYNSDENKNKWNFEIGRLLEDDFTVVDKNAVEFEVQLENDRMTLEWINFMAIKEHWDKPYSS